jgi:hypothetical protein
MNLGVDPVNIHLLTGLRSDGNLHIELPLDLEATLQINKCDPSAQTPSGISAGTQPTKLGPFCRTAEATQLLGRVLEFIAQSSYAIGGFEMQDYEALDSSLQKLIMALLQQATNGWEECCAAIGVCFRFDHFQPSQCRTNCI